MSQEMSTVLITGSNRGIGLEFVKQYSQSDCNVIATCRNPSKADDLNELAKTNSNINVLAADITQEESINNLSAELNNAAYLGPPDPQKFGDIDYEMFTRSFEVNAIGPIRITERLIDNVRSSDTKKIIFLGSAAGSIAQITPPVTLYSYRSSKAALHLAVHNLYHELISENVMVSLINPGLVDTRGFLDLWFQRP